MLNVSAVPILTITLRNNFMQVVPVKRWIRDWGCCKFLLDVSIFLSNMTLANLLGLYVGPQAQRQGHLVDHLHHSSDHHRHVREGPSGHDLLHWWYLWAIHLVPNSSHADLVRQEEAWRLQQRELQ